MNIRAMREDDLTIISQIHYEQYKNEFDFPDFQKHFLCSFVTHTDDDQIISAGGVRTLAESVIITDRRQEIGTRREALYNILAASQYVCEKNTYDSLHAFVDPSSWERHLKRVGFVPIKGNGLILHF